jgi:peptide/nickel transport system permease protein
VKYLLRRIAAVIPVMAVVAVVVFLLIQLSPGDPAALIAGDTATTEDVDKIRRAMGLDKPLLQQFGIWAANVATGNLGTSLSTQMPVSQLIGQRMGPTLSIAGFTMLFSVLMAIPLGVLAAWHAGGWLDRLVMLLSVGAFSVPVFMIGYGLVYGFSIKLGWLPVQGYRPLDQGLVPYLRHLVLPCLSLGLVYMALLTRMTRATMLETLSEDYVRTARAKGLATGPVVWHALKNAANPIVTTIGVGVALLIGGVVVTETVFAIPGLGRLTIDAVLRHDYPVIQGVLLVASGIYVLINLLVDLSYRLFDPRIRS